MKQVGGYNRRVPEMERARSVMSIPRPSHNGAATPEANSEANIYASAPPRKQSPVRAFRHPGFTAKPSPNCRHTPGALQTPLAGGGVPSPRLVGNDLRDNLDNRPPIAGPASTGWGGRVSPLQLSRLNGVGTVSCLRPHPGQLGEAAEWRCYV